METQNSLHQCAGKSGNQSSRLSSGRQNNREAVLSHCLPPAAKNPRFRSGPFQTIVQLTVNSPFRFRNSRVPSSGSTRKQLFAHPAFSDDDSSDRMNTPGNAASSPWRITRSARKSACVKGDWSSLFQVSKFSPYTAITSRPAASAMAHKVWSCELVIFTWSRIPTASHRWQAIPLTALLAAVVL
jgi:hypothetical protein